MKADELKRPDLAHLSCGICGEAFQSPVPPDYPEHFDELEDMVRASLDPESPRDPAELRGLIEATIEAHSRQGTDYKLDRVAFDALRDHSESHAMDEHLVFAHSNRIPLVCDCGHEEQATAEGYASMRTHGEACDSNPRTPCASASCSAGHVKAYG